MSGEKRPQVRGGKFAGYVDSATHRATARALFEGKAGTTCAEVAAQMGLAESTIRHWKRDADKAGHPWRVQRRALPELSGRAAAIADQHQVRLEQMGADPTEEQKQKAERETADMVASEARAEVITRHRLEWQLVRRKLYEAIRSGDLAQIRLARDSAEAMDLMQKNERRAWGLDAVAFGPGGEAALVVVERVDGAGQGGE
ncbi:hypothetical protein [Bradyrhizobium sp. USDA 3364]